MGSIWQGFLRFLVAIVGRWEPPGWLALLGRKAVDSGRWARGHKGAAALIVLLLGLLGGGGSWVWFWYQNRPKPTEFSVTVTAPGITSPEPGSTPEPLVIDFNGSVAPLKGIGKPLAAPGLPSLSPKVEGRWTWVSDSRLAFAPKEDWAIGQEFKIALPKRDFAREGALLADYGPTFSTPPFAAALTESEFYQDPVDANLKKVVATVHFSHPVDGASFEKHVKLHLDSRLKTESGADWKFHVTYDKYRLNAYVHSEPIPIGQESQKFQVTIDKGVTAARGGPPTPEPLTTTVDIPGLYNFLKVESLNLTLVENERFEPEQVLILATSAGVQQKELEANLGAWVLPLYEPGNAEEAKQKHPHRWSDPEQIGPEVLKQAHKLPLEAVATEKDFDTLHSFKYRGEPGRYIYLTVKKGVRAFGGYVLGETWQGIARVGEYPAVLHILQEGALVSLGGQKRVSIYARDVEAVRFQIGRVLPDQLHHLVSQSGGRFARPDFFHDYNFNDENLSERFEEVQTLPKAPHGKPQYLGFELGKYLEGGRRGLFFLKAESWDPATRGTTGQRDQRLILITDHGVVVKDIADGTHDLFVQSIGSGAPLSPSALNFIRSILRISF